MGNVNNDPVLAAWRNLRNKQKRRTGLQNRFSAKLLQNRSFLRDAIDLGILEHQTMELQLLNITRARFKTYEYC